MTPQDFYRTHSPMSDPGKMAYLYDALPDDLNSLSTIIQTIYIHYWGGKELGVPMPPERICEIDNRRVETILEKLIALQDAPLTTPRTPEKRVIGCCRDAALLMCSFLRHKGIPARIRSGFTSYINIGHPGFAVDHVITEYWDKGRWKLIDAEQGEENLVHNGITFDVHDIPRDRFIVAGQAWQAVRSGAEEANIYGCHPDDTFWIGLWAIRSRLVNDINSLSKVEYLLWDTWGLMEHMDNTLSEAQLAQLDRAAALTMQAHDDTCFDLVRALNDEPGFAKPERFMCYSPVKEPEEVAL